MPMNEPFSCLLLIKFPPKGNLGTIKDSKCGFGHDMQNRSNAEIAFDIAVKTRFGQLKNLFDAAISFRIGHILNPCLPIWT